MVELTTFQLVGNLVLTFLAGFLFTLSYHLVKRSDWRGKLQSTLEDKGFYERKHQSLSLAHKDLQERLKQTKHLEARLLRYEDLAQDPFDIPEVELEQIEP